MKDLDGEYFKLLKKEIDKYSRKWKDIPFLWIGRINIMEIIILPKVIYRFHQSQSKSPSDSSQKHKQTLRVKWSHKRPQWLNNIVRMCYGILFGCKVKWNNKHWRQMIGWNNPEAKWQISNVLSHWRFLTPNLQIWVNSLEWLHKSEENKD